MNLNSQREYENTVAKLKALEESYNSVLLEVSDDDELRGAELESLTRLINQLKEEIAWYKARQPAAR
jgi:hypothetical protein